MLIPDQNLHNSIPLFPKLNFSFILIIEGTPRGLLYTFLGVVGLCIAQFSWKVSFKAKKSLQLPLLRLGDLISIDYCLNLSQYIFRLE